MASAGSSEEIVLGASGPASIGPVPAFPAADSPGLRLTAARQRAGLSVGDIAAKMRMSVQQIDAIERGDYAKLPTGTFLRGFVRSYAKLVGLDPEIMLTLLEETHADSRRPSIVVPTQNIQMATPGERYSNPRARILLVLALVIAVSGGGAYWWLQIRPKTAERGDRSPTKVTVAAPQPVADPMPAASATANDVVQPLQSSQADANATPSGTSDSISKNIAATAQDAPVAPVPQPAPLTQTTAPLAPAPGAAARSDKPTVPRGSSSLRFSFNGESWVEVVDGSGKTILSRKFQPSQAETIVAKLPVSVVIGNATVARLQYNDLDFDLTPHTRVSVARFTLK